jgi:hypothetical protein
MKKLAIALTAIFIILIIGLSPIANAAEVDDEITCSTKDFHYTILKNSRGELILQGTPDLMPNERIVFGNGRIMRKPNQTDRIFEKNGFKYNIRTVYKSNGSKITYVITERGGEPLDNMPCY